MATRSVLHFLPALLLPLVSALQVTPNSPCASFCLDSNDLDFSDPNSSNTYGKDITCQDNKYLTEPSGQKFQRCLSCLQDSVFSQGKENDQLWFLYNLRYAFDYCILGFPNATDIGSSPCMTSTACGALEGALKDGDLNPLQSTQYSYCESGGGSMLSSAYDKCLACVKAGGDHYYVANYLVALKAGCLQKPEPGHTVGLNDTVFTKTIISIIDPTPTKDASAKGSLKLATTTIVIIVIAVVVAILLASGCCYIQYRKRRARREGRGVISLANRPRGHRPASSLSFRCQTHLTPKSPNFFTIEEEEIEEKPYADPSAALNSNPVPQQSVWNPQKVGLSLQTGSPIIGVSNKPAAKDTLPLRSITTSLPVVPPSVHHSPHQKFTSPTDDYTTPTSTTSAVSTAPLLPIRPYVPSEHGMSSPATGHVATFSPGVFASPASGSSASPLIGQGGWPLPNRQASESPVWETQRTFAPVRDLAKPMPKRGSSLGPNPGSPVETMTVQTSFPPPPSKKR